MTPLTSPQTAMELVVGLGELKVSHDTRATLVTHALGSCVGVTAYDPVRKAGGLLHVMLPSSGVNPLRARQKPAMFADTGLDQLFAQLRRLGCSEDRLVIRAAGGSRLLDEGSVFAVGERNIRAVIQGLDVRRLPLASHDFGGNISRTLRLVLATGEAKLTINRKETRL